MPGITQALWTCQKCVRGGGTERVGTHGVKCTGVKSPPIQILTPTLRRDNPHPSISVVSSNLSSFFLPFTNEVLTFTGI